MQQNENNAQTSTSTSTNQLQIPDISTSNISFISKVPRVSNILLGSSPLSSVSSGSIIQPVPLTPLARPSFGPSISSARPSFTPSTPAGKQSIPSSTKTVKKTVSKVFFYRIIRNKVAGMSYPPPP